MSAHGPNQELVLKHSQETMYISLSLSLYISLKFETIQDDTRKRTSPNGKKAKLAVHVAICCALCCVLCWMYTVRRHVLTQHWVPHLVLYCVQLRTSSALWRVLRCAVHHAMHGAVHCSVHCSAQSVCCTARNLCTALCGALCGALCTALSTVLDIALCCALHGALDCVSFCVLHKT